MCTEPHEAETISVQVIVQMICFKQKAPELLVPFFILRVAVKITKS
jgi:hypothetical protein